MARTAQEILAELGRTQKAYQEYGTAGRKDLQKGSSDYGVKLRAEAKAAGVDLNQIGTVNKYGRDYTSLYTDPKPAGMYDPAQAGRVTRPKFDAEPVPVVVQAPPTAAAPPSAAVVPNPSTDLINKINDNTYNARLQALKKARETAQQGLNSVETTAKEGAYANRNSADVVSMQNAQRLREMMANSGMLGDGQNITANVGLGAARQAAIGDINQQEQNTLTDVSERRGVINNNSALDENALIQEVNAARDNMLLGQFNTDRNFGLQEGGLTGNYNGQRTLPGQQFDWGRNMDTAGLTGFLNGQRTMPGQNFDWQKSTDQRNFDQSKYESDRNYRYTVQQDAIKNGQWQQQFQQDVQRGGFDQASQLWSQAFQENTAVRDDAYRKAQLDQSMTAADRSAAAQAATSIMSSGLVTTTKTLHPSIPGATVDSVSVPNRDALNKYIKSLHLSDSATDALLYQYGLDEFVKK